MRRDLCDNYQIWHVVGQGESERKPRAAGTHKRNDNMVQYRSNMKGPGHESSRLTCLGFVVTCSRHSLSYVHKITRLQDPLQYKIRCHASHTLCNSLLSGTVMSGNVKSGDRHKHVKYITVWYRGCIFIHTKQTGMDAGGLTTSYMTWSNQEHAIPVPSSVN